MPYDIRKQGSKFCVVKKDGGKSFGCHDTRGEAEAQLRAILANTHEPKGASMIKLLAATGYKSREDSYEGRQYLVVPVVALTEGAVWPMAASGYEFVAASELRAGGWNGRPIYLGHPVKDGVAISGNDPKLLAESRIGWIFGAAVKSKKLTMEAWIDKALCEERTPELFERLQAGDPVEVSVGAFVDLVEDKGTWKGRNYKVAWSRIVPDHLALLPDGDLGACSLEMGCGVRAAAEGTRVGVDNEQYTVLLSSLRVIQAANEMSNADLMNKLTEKLRDLEPQLMFAQTYYPVTDPDRVVYQCYGTGDNGVTNYGKYELWQRAFTLNKDGTIELDVNRVAVEPVTYYEVILPKAEDVTAAAGARHSNNDRKAIQQMHDHSVYLGASCAPKAAAMGAPCSCHSHAQEEQSMTKEQLAKFLESATPAQIEALTAVAEGKPTPAEVKAAADLKAAADAKDASDKAAAEAKTAAEKSAAELKAAKEQKPPTFDELLASADGETRDMIEQGRAAGKAKKDESIKTLSELKNCPYSADELKAMSQKELDRLITLAAIPALKGNVDYSAQAPRGANSSAPQGAPTPPSQVEAIRAMRQPAAAAK